MRPAKQVRRNKTSRRTPSGNRGVANAATFLSAALNRMNSHGSVAPFPDARSPASCLAEALALNLDDYWPVNRVTEECPIDLVDMFSGCGGMSLGFAAVNSAVSAYKLVAAVDIDGDANATYEKNLGLRPAAVDVAKVARNRIKLEDVLPGRRSGAPLILIGCAPCQGFSSHRNKAGETDARNSLFTDFSKIAAKLRPAAIIVENVPEILTDRYWPIVAKARKRLEALGYWVHLSVHNTASFGVPQERFRVLMMAMQHPFVAPTGFLNRNGFRTVRSAIADLPPVSAGERVPSDEMHYSTGHKRATIETIRQVPRNGGNRPMHVGPECLRRAAKKNGRAVYEDVYGRLSWDKPAITITAYARNPASGRFVHPYQHRGLTIREAALLQGFPRSFSFAGSLDSCFRQIGNAVPPVFSAYLASHLLGELLSEPLESSEFDPGITAAVGASFSRMIASFKAGHRAENPGNAASDR